MENESAKPWLKNKSIIVFQKKAVADWHNEKVLWKKRCEESSPNSGYNRAIVTTTNFQTWNQEKLWT